MKLKFTLCCLFVALGSCVTAPRKKPPQPTAPDVRNELAKVEIDKSAGSNQKAIDRLNSLLKKYPDSDVADDAYIMLGDIYYEAAQFEPAYNSYISVVQSDIFSPREADALYGSARSLYKLGRYDEALALTDRGLKEQRLDEKLRFELHQVKFLLLQQFGDSLEALRSVIYLANTAKQKSRAESFRLKAMDFVESRLNDKELETVANDSNFDFVRGYALFRVGQNYFDQRDYQRAKDYFEKVIVLQEDTEVGERAKILVTQIEARRQVNPRTIGAVLPLSGRHAKVGYKTLRGLQLGLGIYGNERSSFNLAVIDSEGNPDTARRAVERLVTEDHVIAIVGSLLSRTSVAVASKADELGVPVIGLSQKSGLTDIGEYVFRNALTSEAQISQLVSVAMDQYKLRRFAILYPNDPYGIEYANLFWDEVLSRGGVIAGAQSYKTNETDFRGAIQRLSGTYYLIPRADEYRLRFEGWLTQQSSLETRKSPPDSLLPPIVDFDALFVPDSTKAAGQVAAMLSAQDVKGIKLLGTNLWNSSSLIRRGQRLVEGSLFIDGLLKTDESFTGSLFYREFEKAFNDTPGIFAAQAYDAGLILRQIIAKGERSRVGIKEELTQLKNFTGAIGILETTANRELKRPLVHLTVKDGAITRTPISNN